MGNLARPKKCATWRSGEETDEEENWNDAGEKIAAKFCPLAPAVAISALIVNYGRNLTKCSFVVSVHSMHWRWPWRCETCDRFWLWHSWSVRRETDFVKSFSIRKEKNKTGGCGQRLWGLKAERCLSSYWHWKCDWQTYVNSVDIEAVKTDAKNKESVCFGSDLRESE